MVRSELSLLVMSNSLFFIPTNIAKEYQYYYLSHRSHLGSFFFFFHSSLEYTERIFAWPCEQNSREHS